jgi:hypothetical protein
MTATTGLAFMGLSVGCARCHDHKYDPIPSADYYALAATFGGTIRSEIELALEPAAEPVKVQVTSEGLPPMKHHADDRGFPHFYPETYVLARGDVNQKQRVAEPGFLRALMHHGTDASLWRLPQPEGWTRTRFRRASLARWITDSTDGAGGLAARVIVNRLWQHHFGEGLVATPNDFGTQGAEPTHPRLLEWLSADLVDHGWQLKRLHRLMVTSAVYMQSSAYDESRAEKDRDNAFYWRRAPRRLEAEPIRDAMLAVSGQLDTRMYGPGTLDQEMQRRSVYFFIKRSQLVPMMMLFDWPEHLVSIGRRSTTTIAPQALLLLNNPQVRNCAERMAEDLARCPEQEQIARGYLLALGRGPRADELQLGVAFLKSQATAHRTAGHESPATRALTDFCQMLFAMNEFLYVD